MSDPFKPPAESPNLAAQQGWDGKSVAIDGEPAILRATYELPNGHKNSIVERDGQAIVVDHRRLEVIG